jgi:hypothetical protein
MIPHPAKLVSYILHNIRNDKPLYPQVRNQRRRLEYVLTYFCSEADGFFASACIPAWTHFLDSAACCSILALSLRSSLILCGSGTWRPFSTPGRAAYGEVKSACVAVGLQNGRSKRGFECRMDSPAKILPPVLQETMACGACRLTRSLYASEVCGAADTKKKKRAQGFVRTMRSSQALSAGNSSTKAGSDHNNQVYQAINLAETQRYVLSIPDQPAMATHPQCAISLRRN